MCQYLEANFLNINFFQQLVTTFIAIVLSFLTALLVDNILKKRKIKSEKPQFIKVLKSNLYNNEKLINSIKNEVDDCDIKIPSMQLSSYYFESISLKKFDFIKEYKTCTKIDELVSEIQQTNFLIQLLREREFIMKINSRHYAVTQDLSTKFIERIEAVSKLINDIKDEIA